MSVEQFGYKQELHRALTFRDLLVYGMIFMVPIAPFGVFGYVWDGAQGMVALAYLIGMVAMFFTAMSYWSMSRAFPVSGSVYAYAQRGIHPIVGFFAGWLILLDYILVPSLLYIVSAAALAPMLPGVPGWLWIVGFIAINSLINLRGITFTARANNTILIAEIVVLSVFVVLGLIALYSGAGAGHLAVEIYRNGYQRANASRLHHLHQLLAVIADGGVDIGGAGHGMDKIQRLFALLLQQHAHPQLAGVEVNPVAKDKQQQQGDDHRNQPAAGVADNLPRLFHAQGAYAPPR